MAIYTGVADANGDFTVPFSSNYTGGQKITVTAEKDSAAKSIELFAPSEPVPPVSTGFIQFSGSAVDFPQNIGEVKLTGFTGAIGASTFYANEAGVLWKRATKLTIENGPTAVESSAFYGWGSTQTLVLPESVTSIGNSAFYNWVSATSLVIPDAVTSIASLAFYGWQSAKSLTLPNSIFSILDGSFQNWIAATDLVVPNSVETIGGDSFRGWNAATSLTISSAIASIGTRAFGDWGSCAVVTCLATTPPTIASNTFLNIPAGCIFKVPAASVAAYQAAANWSAFASRIQAI